MKKTSLEDWKIVREEPTMPFLTHCIYETENSNFAFFFSQIEEWSLMKYCTHLQIYKDKEAPKKIYDSKSVWFLFNIFSEELDYIYDWTSDMLICFRQLINHGQNKYTYPYIIINLGNFKFTAIRDKLFTSLVRDGNIITSTETIIDKENKTEKKVVEQYKLDEMEWLPLSELSDKATVKNSN